MKVVSMVLAVVFMLFVVTCYAADAQQAEKVTATEKAGVIKPIELNDDEENEDESIAQEYGDDDRRVMPPEDSYDEDTGMPDNVPSDDRDNLN